MWDHDDQLAAEEKRGEINPYVTPATNPTTEQEPQQRAAIRLFAERIAEAIANAEMGPGYWRTLTALDVGAGGRMMADRFRRQARAAVTVIVTAREAELSQLRGEGSGGVW